MAPFASGKNAYFISDRSGIRYPYRDMKVEWTGAAVGPDEFEPKHPQLEPRNKTSDFEALRNSRTDRTEPAVQNILTINPFQSGSSGSSIITVTEKSHGRSTSDVVRFRNVGGFDGFTKSTIENSSGYSITKVNADTYTFTVTSETATTGNTRGGGDIATAGPVTLSA